MKIREWVKDVLTAIVFVAVISVVAVSSYNQNSEAVWRSLKNLNATNISQTVDDIEGTYRDGIVNRNGYIDLYGIVQNVLCKKMIGNFEYVKDSKGIIHIFTQYPHWVEDDFIKDIQIISSFTSLRGVPTVYVQNPYPTLAENSGIGICVNDIAEGIHEMCNRISDKGIDCIEMAEIFRQGGYSEDDIFIKSDGGHMTTSAEMVVANEIISYLEDKCGKSFDEKVKNNALNMDNYNVQNFDMMGNFARSSGRYFSNIGKFDFIVPKFDTNVTLKDYSTGDSKNGTFEEVETNGYQYVYGVGAYTYWVTDYLKYPSHRYEIVNNNVQDNNIMLIMDSTAIRTAAILSLAAHKVTVIDPRFGSYENFIDAFNSDDYDAVFVVHNYTLMAGEYGGLLPDDFSYLTEAPAEVVECDIPEEIGIGKTYDFSVTVKNLGESTWNESSRIRLCMEVNDEDYARGFIENSINVLQGEEYEFKISSFKLDECGDFKLSFRIVQEGISYFETAENGTILVKATE